jgi:hypothetical protein
MICIVWFGFPRCEKLIQAELSVGISAKIKRNRRIKYFNSNNLVFPVIRSNVINSSNSNNSSLDRSKLWCSYADRYGGSWSDF